MIHNRKSLITYLNKTFNWTINYTTFWLWEKKGFVKPDTYLFDGKRKVPVYFDVEKIKNQLLKLVKEKKLRVKEKNKKNEKK